MLTDITSTACEQRKVASVCFHSWATVRNAGLCTTFKTFCILSSRSHKPAGLEEVIGDAYSNPKNAKHARLCKSSPTMLRSTPKCWTCSENCEKLTMFTNIPKWTQWMFKMLTMLQHAQTWSSMLKNAEACSSMMKYDEACLNTINPLEECWLRLKH